jgi:glycine/D-amino acid oxidase-like deaminating enzyme/nitrite reductase/ring-hydroxylating ferredoxin subunit
MDEGELPAFAKLSQDLTVDVTVVGGGFTGIVTAYALKRAGLKVALLERDGCGQGDTGHTTAHLTHVTDTSLPELAKRFGKDHAGAVWDSGKAAMEFIFDAVSREQIPCELKRVPGFRHLPRRGGDPGMLEDLRREAALAQELGFDAEMIDSVPVMGRSGVRFANQAKIHPLKYLRGLLKAIPGDGCHVFEGSEVVEFSKEKHAVKANGYWVRSGFVVLATEVPLQGEKNMLSGTLFQSKLIAYSTYAIGARLPGGIYPEACFWDTNEPYDYLRIDRGATLREASDEHAEPPGTPQKSRNWDFAIYGGEDHKTGQADDTAERFARLEERLLQLLPPAEVVRCWSGQVIETVDGLPLIGEIGEGQFVATGYSGNGITFGVVAAMMACDAVLKRKNPWKDLFDPHRKKLSAAWDYVKENADYPYYLVKDRFKREGRSLDELGRGEGKLLHLNGKRLACYRDDEGKVSAVSSVCTHMGCVVHWNAAEKTWDCPCHGSRFGTTGDVIAGPAETALKRVEVTDSGPDKQAG